MRLDWIIVLSVSSFALSAQASVVPGTYQGRLSCGPHLQTNLPSWNTPLELKVSGNQIFWRRAGTDSRGGVSSYLETATGTLVSDNAEIRGRGQYEEGSSLKGEWNLRGNLKLAGNSLSGSVVQLSGDNKVTRECTATFTVQLPTTSSKIVTGQDRALSEPEPSFNELTPRVPVPAPQLQKRVTDKAYNCSTSKGAKSIRAFLPNGMFFVDRKDPGGSTYFIAKYKVTRGNTTVPSAIGIGYDSPRMKEVGKQWEEIVHMNYDEYLVNAGRAKVFFDGEQRLDCAELSAGEKQSFFQMATTALDESKAAKLIPGFNGGKGQENDPLTAARVLPQCPAPGDMRTLYSPRDMPAMVQATRQFAAAASSAMDQAAGASVNCQNMLKFYVQSVIPKADQQAERAMDGNPAGAAIMLGACNSYRLVAGNLIAMGCSR